MTRALLRSPLMLAAISLWGMGCSESSSGGDPTPDATVTPDAMVSADAGAPDMGEADASAPDMALPDAEVPDAGPPRRVLVEASPFGDAPLDNLVMNPELDLGASGSIIPLPSGEGADRLILPSSPTGQAALRLTSAEGLLVSFQAREGALEMSVWLGGAEGVPFGSEVTVLALPRGEGDLEGVRLAAEGDVLTLEGVRQQKLRWQRYVGTVDVALLGHSYMLIQGPESGGLWVTSPQVVQAPVSKRAGQAAVAQTLEAVSPRTRRLAEAASARVAEDRAKRWDRPAAEGWLIKQAHPKGQAPLRLIP